MRGRFASVGGARRHIRDDASVLMPPVKTLRSILGSKLVALWDTRYGIAYGATDRVDTWTDQIQGIVCQAPSATERPSHLVDVVPTNFRGRKMVLSDAATSRRLVYQGSPIAGLAAGVRPLSFVVGRAVAFDLGAHRWFLRLVDDPQTQSIMDLLVLNTGQLCAGSGSAFPNTAWSDTAPVMLNAYTTAANSTVLATHAGVLASAAGAPTLVAPEIIGLGGGLLAGSSMSAYLGQIGICNAPLTAAEDAALTAFVRTDWGF